MVYEEAISVRDSMRRGSSCTTIGLRITDFAQEEDEDDENEAPKRTLARTRKSSAGENIEWERTNGGGRRKVLNPEKVSPTAEELFITLQNER